MSGIQQILNSIKPGLVRLISLFVSGAICLYFAISSSDLWGLTDGDTFNQEKYGFIGIVAYSVIFTFIELVLSGLTYLYDFYWTALINKLDTAERIKELEVEPLKMLQSCCVSNSTVIHEDHNNPHIRVLTGLELLTEWLPPSEVISQAGIPPLVPYHLKPYVKELASKTLSSDQILVEFATIDSARVALAVEQNLTMDKWFKDLKQSWKGLLSWFALVVILSVLAAIVISFQTNGSIVWESLWTWWVKVHFWIAICLLTAWMLSLAKIGILKEKHSIPTNNELPSESD